MSSVPVITCIDRHGHLHVDWPHPIAPEYPMSVEVIREVVDLHNAIADIRQAAAHEEWAQVAILWNRLMSAEEAK